MMSAKIFAIVGLSLLTACAAVETPPEPARVLESVVIKQKQVFSADGEASAVIIGLAELMSAREEVNISDGLSEPDQRRSHYVRVATLIVLTSRQYAELSQPERAQVDMYMQALNEAIARVQKSKSKYD